MTIWQMVHLFPDGHRDVKSQFPMLDRRSQPSWAEWVKKTKKKYPLPLNAVWECLSQNSPNFHFQGKSINE